MAPPKKMESSNDQEQAAQPVQSASFADFGLSQELLEKIRANGFERPSDVQQAAIPYLLERQDVLCEAKSGKGKTCVFVLSILQLLEKELKSVEALVLCHTHELALEICEEFERFAQDGVKVARAVGKVPVHIQKKQIEEMQPEIVVGTLGRIDDLIERKILNVEGLKFLVVDEADNMMNDKNIDGFAKIMARLGSKNDRQTAVFSATYTQESIDRLKDVLREGFKEIRQDDKNLVLHGLVEKYMKTTEQQKLELIFELLKLSFTQAVIFTKNVERCRSLQEFLQSQQIDCNCFFGGMPENKRKEIFEQFKKRQTRVMVATDIFQRGVDFEGVNLVINFDMPANCDAYLHRSGRAGRFETNGLVVSFIGNEEDQKILDEIEARFAVEMEELVKVDDIDEKRCFLK